MPSARLFCSWPISYRQCNLQAISGAHLGLGFQMISLLGFWHTLFHGWPKTPALLFGLPRSVWLFASGFSGIDFLSCLQALVLVWLPSAQSQHPADFPICRLRNSGQRSEVPCLEAHPQCVAQLKIQTLMRKDSGRLRALRLGVGTEEGERCPNRGRWTHAWRFPSLPGATSEFVSIE